eukprot:TRINITY_DN2621_c0_g1_i5.p1 TRINITY_DN2621_c0_g1~~TRINITY_DN2621_c0_g1_i5.p1  ORF type:complete len:363 (-),score=58.13 TRINITY_DN2621_c0_g1_i5:135-1127(-)
MAAIKKAATLILLSPDLSASKQSFRILLARRSAKSSFMPSLFVFPGGMLESADQKFADQVNQSDLKLAPGEHLAHRFAAIRECFEETSLLLACSSSSSSSASPVCDVYAWNDQASLVQARKESSADGGNFYNMLQRKGLELQPASIIPWSRWITPRHLNKRADTFFYLASLPNLNTLPSLSSSLSTPSSTSETKSASADEEVSELVWLSPSEALLRAAEGSVSLAPPTFYVLTQLSAFEKVEQVLNAARHQSLHPILPHPCKIDNNPAVVLPGDHRHRIHPDDMYIFSATSSSSSSSTSPSSAAEHRIVKHGHSWKIVRTRDQPMLHSKL